MRFPFTSRARAERDIAAHERETDRAHKAYDDMRAALANVRGLIHEMYDEHKPYPGRWAELGNGGSGGEWWCSHCRHRWPCKPWRQLRRLDTATYGPEKPDPVPEMEVVVRPKRDPNIADAA